MRDDFFTVAEFARGLGFDIHCNTNCTIVSDSSIDRIAHLFPAICTSLHGAGSVSHDAIVGRQGAFQETISGIRKLTAAGVYVTVNITVSRKNRGELPAILDLLASLHIGTVLLSRVLTDKADLAINDTEMIELIRTVKMYQDSFGVFQRTAFPQPFPPCKCGVPELHDYIRRCNIACSAGMLTARITPDGLVTPCPVLDVPVIGDCKEELFSSVWDQFMQKSWKKTMPKSSCVNCPDLASCGGGCLQKNSKGILIYSGVQ